MPPGPIPKRSEERRRRNKDTIEVTTVDVEKAIAGVVEVPVPEDDWHPLSRMMFDAAQKSGQSIFYEPSDWAAIFLLCDQIDRWMQPQPVQVGSDENGNPEFEMRVVPMPGATINAITKLMASVMMTEGDRRRVRIELDRKAARDAAASGGSNVVPISTQRAERFRRPVQK